MLLRLNFRAAALLVVVSVILSFAGPARVEANSSWTFGAEYLAYVERYESGNRWYESEVYWRPAYVGGVYQFEEFVRRVDYYRGPVSAYGPIEVASQSLGYPRAPHLSLVTTYRRPVYLYGQLAGYEDLPEVTTFEDACQVSHGPEVVESATIVQTSSGPMLRVVYSYPIYHANERYGRFVSGQGERVELTPVSVAPTSAASPGADGAAPLDTALRTMGSIEEFSDYMLVAQSRYAQDIGQAFELGLVVGRYDEASRYYAPESLITLGEMVNILARNYGAASSVQGSEAAAYLSDLGVVTAGGLDETLRLSQLAQLAGQLTTLDLAARADLLVIRQVLDGSLASDPAIGITRAHAVAMYRGAAAGQDSEGAPAGTAAATPVYEPVQTLPAPLPSGAPIATGSEPAAGEGLLTLPEFLYVLVD